MCTLSIFPWEDGSVITMNRDESRAREEADTLYKNMSMDNALRFCYPVDTVSGGTWFGFNAQGIALAILNRYQDPSITQARSRGKIIPQLLKLSQTNLIIEHVKSNDFSDFNPFDLFVIDKNSIYQFSWNRKSVNLSRHSTDSAHFFSSSSINTNETLSLRQRIFSDYVSSVNSDWGSAEHVLLNLHLLQDKNDPSSSINMARHHSHTKSISQLILKPSWCNYYYFNESALNLTQQSSPLSIAPSELYSRAQQVKL